MTAVLSVLNILRPLNTGLLAAGRWVGVFAIGLMVLAILIQVFFRYVLGSALPWPDEAARFCMLWMTGLMAPTALRSGGFVAIDVVDSLLRGWLFHLLQLLLLMIGLTVLIVGIQIGYKEVTGLGGRFATASLYLPTSLGFDNWFRVPRSWMMLSLVVGLGLLILVNIELILERIVRLFGQGDRLPERPGMTIGGAE
ncbi:MULTISPECIES: TRAP transporter small permease [Phaeobacter]|uniref:TRAP transporter small permease protein n=1 Tax=Phaeobacter inhibens TaxID=221822 RepID=A0A135IMH4_9RHOB|nr:MULTISPECIES: TRAP transporter small permease subunit [Phaeobacter]APX14502.1 C4-dicarboxylate ABC transporter permease [Phaeobacter inhibens]AUQ53992.1 TRAP transporter, subunit DctQ [Phaeobacter inhibens]AUQ58245.1 TRAP transporter, subunit DctQ [Phaeobacter inhibens]AUQ62290.1 TRAP transporter, subunit DctQ [Phaeobacter inhibens]AUQ66792.1 TRAP transporter, subunit DctQ [Phaeobacter inhibens]